MSEPGERRELLLPLTLDRAASDGAALEMPCSFASDAILVDEWLGPVRLAMTPEAVDLTVGLARGIPVHEMHYRGLPVARVMAPRLDGNLLRGVLRFSRTQRGQDLYRDASDGILTDLSVGAVITAVSEQPDHLLALRWTPAEVSLVDTGADPAVGINRRSSSPPAAAPAAVHSTGAKTTMPEPIQAADPAAGSAGPLVTTVNTGADGARAANIMELSRYISGRYPDMGIERMAEDHCQFGEPFEAFRGKVWKMVQERQAKEPGIVAPSPASQLGLSQREAQQFSIVRAANAYLTGDWKQAGFELEASRAIADKLNRQAKGFFVPTEVQGQMGALSLQRVAQSAGDPTYGGFLVADQYRGDLFIEALRARSVAMEAGVRSLPGLVGNLPIPKVTGSATFYWITEGGSATDTNLQFGQIAMSPRTIAGAVPMTRRLLQQSSPAVEQLVRSDLVTGAALAIDLAVFEGTAAAGQPLGVVNHPSINTVAVTTDGTPTWDEVVQFETEIATDNALAGSLSYITTPAVRGKMKVTPKATNQAIFIADGNSANGYPVRVSTQLATHTLLFGDWSQIIVGFWGVLDIQPDVSTLASSGGLVLRAFQDVDTAIRHAIAFAKAT